MNTPSEVHPGPSPLAIVPAPREVYVYPCDAFALARSLPPESVDLLLTDPPYFGMVSESWDNQWTSVQGYVDWMMELFAAFRPALKPHASVVFFGGIGKPGFRPFQRLCLALEENGPQARAVGLHYRNTLTWKKMRGYGKSHDYLFCREEIAWYSVSPERTNVRFNIPFLPDKVVNKGWNPDYPCKNEFKRVSNVIAHIPELFKPERVCQKPLALMSLLVETHSNPGDLVVDPFAGWGSTGVAAINAGRDFLGSEAIAPDAEAADLRCVDAYNARLGR